MTTPVDLTSCDREPIHTPEAVQPHGVLLSLDPRQHTVDTVSDNTAALGGRPAEAWLGQPLFELLSPAPAAAIADALRAPEQTAGNPLIVHTGACGLRTPANVILHHHLGTPIVELEAVGADAYADRDRLLERANGIIQTLQRARDHETFADALVLSLRRLLGYDRVMLYRFAEDWHGWVAAEARRDDLEPFLGLHYPASDIPRRARDLFLVNRVRMIQDVDAAPARLVRAAGREDARLDMTHAVLRGVSPIHIEYLQNMGVKASLTMGIERNGELWGMVACHHYASAKYVETGRRSAAELIVRAAEFRAADLDGHAESRQRAAAQTHHHAIAQALAGHASLATGLEACRDHLQPLVGADGFVAWIEGDAVAATGEVPEPAVLEAVAARLSREAALFTTDALPAEVPAAAEASNAAGLLAVPIAARSGSWLLFFRGEYRRTIHWAGSPHKAVEVGPLGDRLTPRKSFEAFCEEIAGRSRPWTPVQAEAAEHLRVSLSDVIFRERERLAALTRQLEQRNEELERYSSMASHDLREPLRAIQNYAAFLREDVEDEAYDELLGHAASIERLTRRMNTLIEGLLTFARQGSGAFDAEELSLQVVLQEVIEDQAPTIEARGADVAIEGPLPTLCTWEVGVREIFSNLLANALKYCEGPPRIRIGVRADVPARRDPSSVVLYIADNGVGIAPEHEQSAFRLFQRLQSVDRFGPGTGLGLPIARKLADRMGGGLWLESTVGEGSTFFVELVPMPEEPVS